MVNHTTNEAVSDSNNLMCTLYDLQTQLSLSGYQCYLPHPKQASTRPSLPNPIHHRVASYSSPQQAKLGLHMVVCFYHLVHI